MRPTFTKAYHGPGYPKAEPTPIQFISFDTSQVRGVFTDLLAAVERVTIAGGFVPSPLSRADEIRYLESRRTMEREQQVVFSSYADPNNFGATNPIDDMPVCPDTTVMTQDGSTCSDPTGAVLRDSVGMRVQSIVGFKDECGHEERQKDWSEFKTPKQIWKDYARIKAAGNP